jgi:hypothetical protein
VSGMGGYTSKCEKKSKSLHPSVHIRDKVIKGCIQLGSLLTVGTHFARIVSCLHQLHIEGSIFTGNAFIQMLDTEQH